MAVLIDEHFHDLTVIERAGSTKDRRARWKCRCNCGKEVIVTSTNLKSGNSKSCGCRLKSAPKTRKDYSGYEEITGAYWRNLKGNAKARGKKVSISIKEAYQLFIEQDRTCALSGIKIDLSYSNPKQRTASLDRIDSNGGYTLGNVQWVHKHINKMKSNFDEGYFLGMVRAISDFQERMGN